jgi:hypothetical protein
MGLQVFVWGWVCFFDHIWWGTGLWVGYMGHIILIQYGILVT